MKKDKMDKLVSNAIYICKDYDEVSIAMFQRKLAVGYEHAKPIFDELVKIGLISNYWTEKDDDYDNLIGKVDKQKLKMLLTN